MTKTLAITPSFTAWRRAADRLLTLETALALRRRTAVPAGPGAGAAAASAPDEAEVEKTRLLASALFEVAQAETNRARRQESPGPLPA